MKKKIVLSQEARKLMEDALEEVKVWHYDSVNSPVLISCLINYDKAMLVDYLHGFVEDEEIDRVLTLMISERNTNLRIKVKNENSKRDEKTTNEERKENAENSKKSEEIYNFKPEIKTEFDFIDSQSNHVKVPVNYEVEMIFSEVIHECTNKGISVIEPIYFTCALFRVNDTVLSNLFNELEINYSTAKKHFTSDAIYMHGMIPFALSGFLRNLNESVDVSKPCEILMRDDEVKKLWNICLKKNKRNAVIVGEAGVGKTALIERMTYEIVKGTCPKRFKMFSVISLDVNSLIAGTSFRGDAEERIRMLIEFLEKNEKVILFIDEVHTILGAGSCFEGEMDLSNALKPILARGDTIVIGATTDGEYERYFSSDAALNRRFEKVTVEEPSVDDIYPMIRNKIKSLSNFHKVEITKTMVNYIILIANCFAFEKKNPDKTLDLIDRAMVSAARAGNKRVTKENVMENFEIYIDLFNGMTEEEKFEIAYHEAGHYMVGKLSGRLNLRWLAVSIMPSSDYAGITVSEEIRDRMKHQNKEYFLDLMAFYLAGRAAGIYYNNDYDVGASNDLVKVNKVAYDVITKWGMSPDYVSNVIYLNDADYPMTSEIVINNINNKVRNLIQKSYHRAEGMIRENSKLLDALAKALVKNHIMSEMELNKIWKRFIKSE